MALTHARRLYKIIFYFLTSLIIGRISGHPENWLNPDIAISLGNIIYGPGDIGADNLYNLYFYISLITIFSVTTVIFILTMTLVKKLRSK